MTKEQKKALYDQRKKMAIDAGITDKKVIADIASGKVELGAVQGGPSEQGKDLAGEESGQASGSLDQEKAQGGQPADNSSENPDQDAPKQAEKKVWKMKSNVNFNGKEFKKGEEISKDHSAFKDLKDFIE